MHLLDIRKLTMRFGGLTAANQVDLQIEPGQIFSVIGPNGAGKTTVFNAITGIYQPTEGTVQFDGRPLIHPVTWRPIAMCVTIGLLTALAALGFSANIDGMWRATIKRNFNYATNKFDTGQAINDVRGYLADALAVERQPRNRWAVVTADGDPILGAPADKTSREAAERLRDDIQRLLATGKPIEPAERGERWAIMSADGEVLTDYATQTTANRVAEELLSVREEQLHHKRTAWIALLVGFALGATGTWVVWNRSRRTPDFITQAGIARTFQNIRLFAEMTVLENVMVALRRKRRPLLLNLVRIMLRTPGIRKEESAIRCQAIESLRFVGLEPVANDLANSLAYGDQRRLEIARALATGPKLLLLDEPAAGMNPAETSELMELIRRIRQNGVTILLIEHHMKVVMGISDRIAVLDYGLKIAEGSPEEVRRDPKVIEAYLGKEGE